MIPSIPPVPSTSPEPYCTDVNIPELNNKFNFDFNFGNINNNANLVFLKCASSFLLKDLDLSLLQLKILNDEDIAFKIPKKILIVDGINVISNIFVLKNILKMHANKQLVLTELDELIILFRMYYIRNNKYRDLQRENILADEEITNLLKPYNETNIDKLVNLIKEKINSSKHNLPLKRWLLSYKKLSGFSTQINFYLSVFVLYNLLQTKLDNFQIYIVTNKATNDVQTNSKATRNDLNMIDATIRKSKKITNDIVFIEGPCYTENNILCEKSEVDDFIIVYLYYYFYKKFEEIGHPINQIDNINLIVWTYDNYRWYNGFNSPKLKFNYNNFSFDFEKIDLIPDVGKLQYNKVSKVMNPLVNLTESDRINFNNIAKINENGMSNFENIQNRIIQPDDLLKFYNIKFNKKIKKFIHAINYLDKYKESIQLFNTSNKKKIVIDVVNLYLNLNFLKKLRNYKFLDTNEIEFLEQRIELFNVPIEQKNREKLFNLDNINIFTTALVKLCLEFFVDTYIFFVYKTESTHFRYFENGTNRIIFIGINDNSLVYDTFVNGDVTFATYFLYQYFYTNNPETLLWSYNSFDYNWIDTNFSCTHSRQIIKLNGDLGINIIEEQTKAKICNLMHIPCAFSNINEQFCTYFDILK